jgi:hypothetical protein
MAYHQRGDPVLPGVGQYHPLPLPLPERSNPLALAPDGMNPSSQRDLWGAGAVRIARTVREAGREDRHFNTAARHDLTSPERTKGHQHPCIEHSPSVTSGLRLPSSINTEWAEDST